MQDLVLDSQVQDLAQAGRTGSRPVVLGKTPQDTATAVADKVVHNWRVPDTVPLEGNH